MSLRATGESSEFKSGTKIPSSQFIFSTKNVQKRPFRSFIQRKEVNSVIFPIFFFFRSGKSAKLLLLLLPLALCPFHIQRKGSNVTERIFYDRKWNCIFLYGCVHELRHGIRHQKEQVEIWAKSVLTGCLPES